MDVGHYIADEVLALTEADHFCATLLPMTNTVDNIVSSIDAEIARLHEARALLAGTFANPGAHPAPKAKRKLSAAAHKRMSQAQKKRWEAQKK